ncbi:hypothetical protein G6F68_013346 [Rhizopus microsporus]|nr:hypothetical protein G6F68_013346 [Rhizopus microsporus]
MDAGRAVLRYRHHQAQASGIGDVEQLAPAVIGADQLADIGLPRGDGAIERRTQGAVTTEFLQPRVVGLRRFHAGLCGHRIGLLLVGFLARYRMAAEHALPALGADLGQRRVGLHLQQVGMRLRDLLVQLRAVDYRQHLPRLHRLADVGAPRLQVAAHAGVDRCFGPGTQVRRQCHRSRSTPRPGGDHLHRRHRLALGPLDHGVCLLRAQGQATGNEDDHHGGGQDQRTAQRMLRQRSLRHAGDLRLEQ